MPRETTHRIGSHLDLLWLLSWAALYAAASILHRVF